MNLIDSFVSFKQRMQYASGYLGMLTTPLLLVDVLQRMAERIDIHLSVIQLAIPIAIGLYLLGWLFDWLGIWHKENDYNYVRQRAMRADLERMNKSENNINKL